MYMFGKFFVFVGIVKHFVGLKLYNMHNLLHEQHAKQMMVVNSASKANIIFFKNEKKKITFYQYFSF